MQYSLRYFLSAFGLGEKPGVQPGEGDGGAARDRTDGQRVEPSSPSTSRMVEELPRLRGHARHVPAVRSPPSPSHLHSYREPPRVDTDEGEDEVGASVDLTSAR